MRFLFATFLFTLQTALLPSVLGYGKDIHPLQDCKLYTKEDEAMEKPGHFFWRPIAVQVNDPTERDGKFKQIYLKLYSRDVEFSVFWGNAGGDDPGTMIQMTANPNDGGKSLQSQFMFKWDIAGGSSYSYTLGWDEDCGLLREKAPFSYHDVREIIVKVRETTCRPLGCSRRRDITRID